MRVEKDELKLNYKVIALDFISTAGLSYFILNLMEGIATLNLYISLKILQKIKKLRLFSTQEVSLLEIEAFVDCILQFFICFHAFSSSFGLRFL